MKKDAVNRLIQRYEMLGTLRPDQTDLIEDLPITLTYDIAKPSADDSPENATPDEAKKRYRKLMHLLHPDKGGDAQLFDVVKKAYDELAKKLAE